MADAPTLKERIETDSRQALRERDKQRLGTLRLALNAVQQREIDERRALSDEEVLGVIEKLIKQRRESIEQYEAAGRDQQAQAERAEIEILQTYLPEPLSEAELNALVDEAIAEAGATGIKEMGKVMGALKPKVQGRAEMGKVSAVVKSRLSGE